MVKPENEFLLLVIRVFKELGIHKIYLKSRENCLCKKVYPIISPYAMRIDRFIDESLAWKMTGYDKLWRELYYEFNCYFMENSDIKRFLEDEKEIKRIKKLIKKNI